MEILIEATHFDTTNIHEVFSSDCSGWCGPYDPDSGCWDND